MTDEKAKQLAKEKLAERWPKTNANWQGGIVDFIVAAYEGAKEQPVGKTESLCAKTLTGDGGASNSTPSDKLSWYLRNLFHEKIGSICETEESFIDCADKIVALIEDHWPTERESVAPEYNYWRDVFKGAECFEQWANNDAFWEKQPYGTRFYFGDGAFDYVNRGVLQAAVKQLNQAKPKTPKIGGNE